MAEGDQSHAGSPAPQSNPRPRFESTRIWLVAFVGVLVVASAVWFSVQESSHGPPAERPEARSDDGAGALRLRDNAASRAPAPPSGVPKTAVARAATFRRGGSGDELHLRTVYWASIGGPVVETDCTPLGFELPSGLDPDSPIHFLGGTQEGRWFTFIELETTFDALVAASPVAVVDGRPAPARVRTASGRECDARLTISGPRTPAGGVIGGTAYSNLLAHARSPIALPRRDDQTPVELTSDDAWLRAAVPAAHWASGETLSFAELVLLPLHDVLIDIRAVSPVTGVAVVLTPSVADGGAGGRPSRSLQLEVGMWRPHPEGVTVPWQVSLAPATYTASLAGFGPEQGVYLHPERIVVDGSGRSEMWIEVASSRPTVPASLRLRFKDPIREIVKRHGRPLDVSVRARESGQWRSGHPVFVVTLGSSARTETTDGASVLLTPEHGFAEGPYDVQIAPIGYVATIAFASDDSIIELDVPTIHAVRLLNTDTELQAFTPRIEPVGYVQPTGVNAPVHALRSEGRVHEFALVLGEYRFARSSLGLFTPRSFLVDAPDLTIEFGRDVGQARREVRFLSGGDTLRLPLSALVHARLSRHGTSVEGALVSAAGFDPGSLTMSGLAITTPGAGTYSLEWSVDVPGRGVLTGRVERLEVGVEPAEPYVVDVDG